MPWAIHPAHHCKIKSFIPFFIRASACTDDQVDALGLVFHSLLHQGIGLHLTNPNPRLHLRFHSLLHQGIGLHWRHTNSPAKTAGCKGRFQEIFLPRS